MFNRASAAVCAAAIAGMLLVPAQLSARGGGGGGGAVGHRGGFPRAAGPIHGTHPPTVRPFHRVNPFAHQHNAPFAHRAFRERRDFRARRDFFAARRHPRAVFSWTGDYGYGLPVTSGDDGTFYGKYYDPSDWTGWMAPPVYAVPPAPILPAALPPPVLSTAERTDSPIERAACRSQTVALSSPSGAERSVTIMRC
jgi:hypothetical protein